MALVQPYLSIYSYVQKIQLVLRYFLKMSSKRKTTKPYVGPSEAKKSKCKDTSHTRTAEGNGAYQKASRDAKGVLKFVDQPEFQPNMTPKEVLHAGSFGGTYFRPISSGVTKQSYGDEVWKELPNDWLEGLDIKTQVASIDYDININKYKVKCGGSLKMWEDSNWIVAQDPYGWFQWYCRFFQGRRTEDDERQISRWKKCTGVNGRWRNNLIGKIYRAGAKFDDATVSPVVRQVLLHWAYTLTEEDYNNRVPKIKKK